MLYLPNLTQLKIMKLRTLHYTLFFAVLFISVSSCDMGLEMEDENQPLFLRFENLTHLTMDDVQVNDLTIGQLVGNTQSEYMEFEQLYLDANARPNLAVSSVIQGANYANEISVVQTNPTISGNCGTGSNCGYHSSYSPSGTTTTATKKIESGFYTIKISANRLPNNEVGQNDLKLILRIEQD